MASENDAQRDWVLIALPFAIAFRVINPITSLVAIAALVAIAFIRKPDGRFGIQAGPLMCFYGACLVVYSRPFSYPIVTMALLLAILLLQLTRTVDARKFIPSIIDGFGLLLVANVFGHVTGLPRAPHAQNLATTSEFVRVIFPFSFSVNNLPNTAAACFVACVFLLREANWRTRAFRILYSASAIYILYSSGSRTALGVTVVLSAMALLTPSASRWIGQFTTVLAALSAFIFPALMNSIGSVITPLATLNPQRAADEEGVVTFQGRAEIWENSIKYWNKNVHDPGDIAFGFGQLGQYRSGVSSTYINIVRTLVDPHPEYAPVHNSFLEQFVDGGVIGWLLFFTAIFWATARLSVRRPQWGRYASTITFVMVAILLGSTTEAFISPGTPGESFWFLFCLVAIASQKPMDPPAPPQIRNADSSVCTERQTQDGVPHRGG